MRFLGQHFATKFCYHAGRHSASLNRCPTVFLFTTEQSIPHWWQCDYVAIGSKILRCAPLQVYHNNHFCSPLEYWWTFLLSVSPLNWCKNIFPVTPLNWCRKVVTISPLTLRLWTLAGKIKSGKVGKKHMFNRVVLHKLTDFISLVNK